MAIPLSMDNIYLTLPTYRHFLTPLLQTTFENTVTKGEIAQNKHILLLPQCFLLYLIAEP